MMEQFSIPWQPSGQDLKRAGQQLTAEHNADWIDQAGELLRVWCAGNQGKKFAFEEFREWAIRLGLEAPTSHHAYGVLPRLGVSKGLIESTGEFRPAKSARTHSHPVRIWRVL